MRKSIILSVLIVAALALSAQEPKKVLFIGNSYTEVNNLPLLVQKVSESVGCRIEYASNTPGGCTFEQHCTNRSMDMICQGGWDIVVLQEQSQLPSFPQSQVEVECLPFAARLVDSIYANNPDGEAMFYMTWGRKNGDQGNAPYFPVLGTYEGMDSMLYERYMYMARTNDASVSPVGRVWHYIRDNYPEIELYSSDQSHPSMAGSYAAACAFYTMIFHNDPTRINYIPENVRENDARTIREVAKTVVFDTLSFWLRQPADTTGPDTTHTDTTHTDTTQVSIFSPDVQSLSLYPNPATDHVNISVSQQVLPCDVALFDMKGRRVRTLSLTQPSASFSVQGLPNGVYFLKTLSGDTRSCSRLLIHN